MNPVLSIKSSSFTPLNYSKAVNPIPTGLLVGTLIKTSFILALNSNVYFPYTVTNTP